MQCPMGGDKENVMLSQFKFILGVLAMLAVTGCLHTKEAYFSTAEDKEMYRAFKEARDADEEVSRVACIKSGGSWKRFFGQGYCG